MVSLHRRHLLADFLNGRTGEPAQLTCPSISVVLESGQHRYWLLSLGKHCVTSPKVGLAVNSMFVRLDLEVFVEIELC